MSLDLEQSIIEYNSQGIIPGPKETEEEYLKRAEYCISLKERLREELGVEIPFSGDEFAKKSSLEEAFKVTKRLYGICPEWVPVFYTDHKLAPWQGGCAWIFQVSENNPKSALIQLRKAFKNSITYLKLYDRKELLSHEMSHIGRLSFDEPKFEEFFAYKSSSSPFRRFFGPIVKSSSESLLFVILMILLMVLDISAIALNQTEMSKIVWYSKLLPLGLIALALIRLALRHRQLKKCKTKLRQWIKEPGSAGEVLYRLTDFEIISFGSMTASEIDNYIIQEMQSSFRWKVLALLYLRKIHN